MLNTKDIFPIGIGTWGIGGLAERDPENKDQQQVEALVHSIDNGMNYVETCYWYAEGRADELLAEAIRASTKKRGNLFLVGSIYSHKNPTLYEFEKEFEKITKIFDTDYIDTLQVTFGSILKWGEKETIQILHKYLDSKGARHVSVTNFNLDYLTRFKKEFRDKLFCHELAYSFEIRENEDLEIIGFANKHNIKTVVFQPLRRNLTASRKWPLLVELSEKYGKTQNQIVLNWLVSKGFLPVTKSQNIDHINENIASLDFEIDNNDLERLNSFRPPGWETPEIDWFKSGTGVAIHTLPNIFDEEYDRQLKSNNN